MEYYLSHTIETIRRDGRRNPDDAVVRLAIEYLKARLPVATSARALLLVVEDLLRSYAEGWFSGPAGITDFDTVDEAITALQAAVEQAELPEVQRPRDPAELKKIADMLMVRPDWHEPDEQDVTAAYILLPTGGSFDNAGHGILEQYVIVYQDLMPVAEIALATLFAWACQAGMPQQPQLSTGGSDARS